MSEEQTVEVDIALDDKQCPVTTDKEGRAILLDDGAKLPKSLFFGKESPCADTFHGKLQFFIYMAAWYKDLAEEHKASKDPKVKRQQKIEKMKAMLKSLEAE